VVNTIVSGGRGRMVALKAKFCAHRYRVGDDELLNHTDKAMHTIKRGRANLVAGSSMA